MARRPRENSEGAVYHVFARGNDRAAIYLDDVDRRSYLQTLAGVTRRMEWQALSYCLMENHVHLLLETPEGNLSDGMQRLHGSYAQRFNRRHSRSGHLFQGRYGAVRAQSSEQVCVAAAYIARNPVRASLCRQAADWPWSSHRAMLDGFGPPWLDLERLLWYFGGGPHAVRSYEASVDAFGLFDL